MAATMGLIIQEGSRRKTFRRATLPALPPVPLAGTFLNLVLMYGFLPG
jgi:hypothetical protein